MNWILFILCLYILKEGFEYLLRYLNLKHLKRFGSSIPPELEGQVDENLLIKIRNYEVEKTRFGFVSSIFGNFIMIIFIFAGLLNAYNSWVASLNLPFVLAGLIFFLLLSYGGTFISISFSLYRTFKIENKYGFNTTTPGLWIGDLLKSMFLSTILLSIVTSTGLWLIQASPDFWWMWIWSFFFILSLFIMYISPYVIEPLFNKFTPIKEKELEARIKELMDKVKIKVDRVFEMDASKRSRHTNAYFTGIGRVKRIILFDTLLQKMNPEEILSVLAHEAGHWKKRHVLKQMLLLEILSLMGTYISFRILQTDILTDLFQIRTDTFFAKVVLLGFVGGIVSFPLVPLSNYLSRRFEREADGFACELSEDMEAMASALIKLSKDNLSNLHPHPLYITFYYSHPPVVERLRGLQKRELSGS
ncbi:MAG: M48 family metallopeptidase [Nitrospirota bacterium]